MDNNELQISQRGIEMPQSPNRKLAPLAYEAESKDLKRALFILEKVLEYYNSK